MRGTVEWRQRSRLLRFFGDHEDCGKGFEFRHPEGAERDNLSVRCKGCGEETEYSSSGEPASDPAFPFPVKTPSRPRLRPRLRERPAEPPPPPPPTPGFLEKLQGNRAGLITACLVLFAGASAVFAVVRLNGGGNDSTAVTAASNPPATQTVAAPGAAASTTPPPATPAPTASTPESSDATPTEQASLPPLRKTVGAHGPSIDVPADWDQSERDGAMVYEPRSTAEVSVRVYYQHSADLTPQTIRDLGRSVLKRDHPGADVQPAPAMAGAFFKGWLVSYGGGEERAQSLYRENLGVLILLRTEDSAPENERADALAAANSVAIPVKGSGEDG